jgi:hypothetical protein
LFPRGQAILCVLYGGSSSRIGVRRGRGMPDGEVAAAGGRSVALGFGAGAREKGPEKGVMLSIGAAGGSRISRR